MKILVVEDQKNILSFMKKGLEAQGFNVTTCEDGDEGYEKASCESYDAVVLDIMLPGRDGLSILKGLRNERNSVPVILLTARTELEDRVEGLNLGADDYLTKPFFIEELVARLHAISRRNSGEKLSILQIQDLTVNLVSRQVQRGDRSIELTAREFNLLSYLMRSPGRVFSRMQIVEHVWDYSFDPGTNIVDVYVKRIRKKITTGEESPLIETVRGVGYRIGADT